ncbi:pentatricopeptide repeat-containing protein At2g03880, mitochondrial [Argentina anserina]|uniref:pentatricopeptide repeat-containing protein At2g03880, mitochondrial n=1 Tax=Argentina anserina TaxID=57926 RepID=UPI00217645AF|nr:pentatricopeptide repeat-containing protein At2g03880, mitochondrial [Potentilla anserina]
MNKLPSKFFTFHHNAYQFCQRVSTHFIHTIVNATQSKFESNLLLKQLSLSGRIDDARQVFDEMPNRDEFSWNTMIAAYANSGRLAEAKQVFDATPSRTDITWSSLISGYCRNECEGEAFRLFWEMQVEGQRPSLYTLGSLLRLCSKLGLLRRGEMVHGYMVKTKFDSNVDVVTGLVDMYAKCKRIFEAECVFESLQGRRNHVVWTVMLTGYSWNGDGVKAMEFFCDMRAQGVESNQFTFPSVLTACALVLALSFGAQVHSCIVQSGFGPNVFVQSALVDMYVKCGDHISAKKVLRSMAVDDVVSWNSMIVGCVRKGLTREALSLFREMRSRELRIDDYTYPSVLNSVAAVKDVTNAMAIHGLIVKTGFEAHQLVGNALVDMYAKQENMESALEMFRHMPDKDVISWTSLVTGYAQNGSHDKALKLFCEMRDAGIYPDQIVIASILSASAELTLLEFGQQIHANFIKSGLQASLSVDNSFVTMYAKCGCLEEATRVFNSMQVQNVITWTALIVGYAQNGRGKESLKFYDQMLATGTQPDFITFIGLLFACSHAGLLEKGKCYFESMTGTYGIKPGPDHYACMIDLLGRSGKFDEAEALLNQMSVEPDGTVWKALLAACRVHGKIDLGERAAENLSILEPMNAVPYVQLSNMYSAAGRWEDAARIRRLMKSKGILKEPGCSWVEMNGQVHTFMSEDRSHSWTTEIYSKIDEIMMFIRKAGYVPDTNFALHDIDKEGKELGLAYHSEKLAIAFGLLTAPPGAPIRIFKNLRVCGDCHTAMKYISRVYLRHIILRDSNCFHHFKEGKCSCDDYW